MRLLPGRRNRDYHSKYHTIARSAWTDYQRCIYRNRSHRRFHGSGRGFDYPNRLIPRHVLQRGWLGYIAYDSRLRQNGASGEAGIVGAFEVFVGTMCICTVTSLVIVVTGLWDSGLDGAPLTLAAFETVLGPVGTIIITVAIFLFALSTTTGWWAYFEVLLRHLCGTNEKLKRTLINVFKVIYPIPGFLVVLLAAVGNDISGADIWEIANLTTGIPAFVNLIVIVILSGKFFQLLKDYKARYLGIGTVDPNFRLFDEEE